MGLLKLLGKLIGGSLLVCIVLLGGFILLLNIGSMASNARSARPQSSQARTPTAVPEPAPTEPPAAVTLSSNTLRQMVGSQAIVVARDGSGGRVLLSVTKSAFDHFVQAEANDDDYGKRDLMQRGEAFTVPSGTRVLLLDSDYSYTLMVGQVRVLSGERTGSLGWAVADAIQWPR